MKQSINITINGVTKQVQFTEPQARIMKRLLNGEMATTINAHRMDGGDVVWYRKDGDYSWGAECVGWRAFNGAMLAIRNAFALDTKGEHQLYGTYIVEPF